MIKYEWQTYPYSSIRKSQANKLKKKACVQTIEYTVSKIYKHLVFLIFFLSNILIQTKTTFSAQHVAGLFKKFIEPVFFHD